MGSSHHGLNNLFFQSATLDIVWNFPRTSFSDKDFQVLTWLLAANGVDYVPSISQMKSQQEELRKHFSVKTKKYNGALGHTYYVNSLAGIISQVRTNLSLHWMRL